MNNISITRIGENGDNNAFFPSAGGGKICTGKDGKTFVVYATTSGTTATMSYDGHKWINGQILPLSRPYMAVDSDGFVHIAGLGEEGVWHFQSQEPNTIDKFSDGEKIYPLNYSALAISEDDTLYYFGSRLPAGAFLKKPKGEEWSQPCTVVNGGIYPGVACHGSSIHVIYCGWNHIPALYEGVYYMRSEDGGKTWQKSDGTPLKLPIQHRSGQEELLSLTQNTGGGESNTHDLCIMVDNEGKPHVLYW
ncbi:hypothetical protein FJZ33_12845 [Candidatus Poribacteria bacterium]|nr:hypothetical protein [Candidatus Poribacteria bacterium]